MKGIPALLLLLLPAIASALPPAPIPADALRSVVVVHVRADGNDGGRTGSGILIQPGLVVTACGVLEGARQISVRLDGIFAAAQLHFLDRPRNLCVLKTAGAPPFDRSLSAGPAGPAVRSGQNVLVVGSPGGQELASIRAVVLDGWPRPDGTMMLRTEVPLAVAVLGGGVFGEDGRPIGMVALQTAQHQVLALAVPTGAFSGQLPGLEPIERYALAVAREIGRDQHFPPEALRQGWNGSVRVRVLVGADGRLGDVSVAQSSGHLVLDEEAIAKVMRAPALPAVPEDLRGLAFSVDVPVRFRLE